MWYLLASKQAFIDLGEGGAQPNISREKIVAFPFALPPLAEQQRIVASVEKWITLIDAIESGTKNLQFSNKQEKNHLL